MHQIADGPDFGPITSKLIQDLLGAGVRLTSQVQDRPDQLASRLQAYTVEITTALALAVGKMEANHAELAAPPAQAHPGRRAAHLSLVKGTG